MENIIMNRINYVCILVIMLVIAGCTFPYPYDNWDSNYADYRIVLLVNPDDAEVLLDGKLIGSAYEFASKNEPLRLHSKNHELVIKKEGYKEEAINLYDYTSPDITIRVTLSEERPYYQSQVKKTTKSTAEEIKPETEPEKEPPQEMTEGNENVNVKVIDVTLEIEPKEAAIYLNGKFWGIAPEGGVIDNLRLEPGKYILEVIKPGFQSVKKELDIKDRNLTLKIKLEKSQ